MLQGTVYVTSEIRDGGLVLGTTDNRVMAVNGWKITANITHDGAKYT